MFNSSLPVTAVEENLAKFHFLHEVHLVDNKDEKSWFPFEIFIRNFAELVRSKKPILHDLRPVYDLCMVCGRQYDYINGWNMNSNLKMIFWTEIVLVK